MIIQTWCFTIIIIIIVCLFYFKASSPAKELLQEKDRRKFFQKYSSVSQELEKCLDCLLLISDSVTALGEEDTLGKSSLRWFRDWRSVIQIIKIRNFDFFFQVLVRTAQVQHLNLVNILLVNPQLQMRRPSVAMMQQILLSHLLRRAKNSKVCHVSKS